ncbi:hypothetical protein F0P96_09175 [Hymenobacter busanensis]|uniref:Uncharacterized protein n=1 Tax=Hymenobacter busanensis TaxID=2607656 RepID=A0AA88FIE9_9BACT|nr:hypothetical protein F0P96_09175 [Hymenobacter busanensis]
MRRSTNSAKGGAGTRGGSAGWGGAGAGGGGGGGGALPGTGGGGGGAGGSGGRMVTRFSSWLSTTSSSRVAPPCSFVFNAPTRIFWPGLAVAISCWAYGVGK